MGSNMPIIITTIGNGGKKQLIISQDAANRIKFNRGEDGTPVNKRALDFLGIRYKC